MQVLNIHRRSISHSFENVSEVFNSLATKNDKLWPKQWPPMVFKDGKVVGSYGGHGPIKYNIRKYIPGSLIEFNFIKPHGFDGIHRLEIIKVDNQNTEIKHCIDMQTRGTGTFIWIFVVKPLHNALIEDALDKLESHFTNKVKKTPWNLWVHFLRKVLS